MASKRAGGLQAEVVRHVEMWGLLWRHCHSQHNHNTRRFHTRLVSWLDAHYCCCAKASFPMLG